MIKGKDTMKKKLTKEQKEFLLKCKKLLDSRKVKIQEK